MRLKITFYHQDFHFTIYCNTARIDWEKNLINCFIPQSLIDPSCCTHEKTFSHDIRNFNKIEAEIRDTKTFSIFSQAKIIHRIVLEMINGEMIQTEGNSSYMNDDTLTEERIKKINLSIWRERYV